MVHRYIALYKIFEKKINKTLKQLVIINQSINKRIILTVIMKQLKEQNKQFKI